MARPAHFTHDDVLDAAMACVAATGPNVSVADIARQLGGPVGSIYHRFTSRDVLVIRLWLRSVQRFQAGLFEIAETMDDPHEAMIAMALHIPQYCRTHQDEAVSLTLFRQERLLTACPAGVRDAVAGVNGPVTAIMLELTQRRYGRLTAENRQWALMATQVAPFGLVRPHLGGPVPRHVDDAVVASTDAILRLGDRTDS
ncbi:TetR/AcrR family transcriptional regulator [Tessaracoccus antarcticus]|uniref:TetR/AcrR family transcriptional regulator n=1 Tax=Tessaracoccus antarcticus TaxID=2479848 RepID=A0A3M0GAC2_9ACTN|nr:TetR/AcrR family transcriptional regulator [Tessaracoccus antarcticus]RMB61920.1 TetR/AcrR family transcriptional regulator [Tessaracoccus antarcticus]